MALYIVSDLHIQGPGDLLYQELLKMLRERLMPGDTLVLAGDVFDLFVGCKSIFIQRYHEFFHALRELSQKSAQMHYIEGNHDFLIRDAFAGITGLQVHSKELDLELGEKRFLVIHGDTVDRKDYGYRFLRSFFRSPLMKAFVWMAPGTWLDRIGNYSSEYSRAKKPRVPHELSLERRERLRKIYRSFAAERLSEGFDYVAMGHCHDLDEMTFQIGHRKGQYINVGYPPVHGSVLTWAPGDEFVHRTPFSSK